MKTHAFAALTGKYATAERFLLVLLMLTSPES